MAKRNDEKKRDPFWLFIMAILILFTAVLLAERVRFAILLIIGIIICYMLYRNPIKVKP